MQPQPTTALTTSPWELKVFRRQSLLCNGLYDECNGYCIPQGNFCCTSGYYCQFGPCTVTSSSTQCCPSSRPNGCTSALRATSLVLRIPQLPHTSITSILSVAATTIPTSTGSGRTTSGPSVSAASERATSNLSASASASASAQATFAQSSTLPKIIGPVVGVVVLLALAFIFFCWRRHRRAQPSGSEELESNNRSDPIAIAWTGAEKQVDTDETIPGHYHPVETYTPVAAPPNIPPELTRTELPQEFLGETTAVMATPQRYDTIVDRSPPAVQRPESPSEELEWIEEEERKARERTQALQDLRSLREAEARMQSEENRIREEERRLEERLRQQEESPETFAR